MARAALLDQWRHTARHSGNGGGRQRRARNAAAARCTVGVSWNNFQQPRWAAHDEPNIKKTVEAGGGTLYRRRRQPQHRAAADGHRHADLQGAKVLILLAQDNKAILPALEKAKDAGHPGHRL